MKRKIEPTGTFLHENETNFVFRKCEWLLCWKWSYHIFLIYLQWDHLITLHKKYLINHFTNLQKWVIKCLRSSGKRRERLFLDQVKIITLLNVIPTYILYAFGSWIIESVLARNLKPRHFVAISQWLSAANNL